MFKRSWMFEVVPIIVPGLLVAISGTFDPPLLARQSGKWAGTPQENFANSDLMKKYQCVTCHTVMDGGGTVGPILNQVARGTRHDRAGHHREGGQGNDDGFRYRQLNLGRTSTQRREEPQDLIS